MIRFSDYGLFSSGGGSSSLEALDGAAAPAVVATCIGGFEKIVGGHLHV